MKILSYIIYTLNFFEFIKCHGRLDDPPSRNSAWRIYDGFPINYDDNGLASPSSVCGSKFYEIGSGFSTNGKILKTYYSGQIITIHSVISANHLGSIEISICKLDIPNNEATQDCFNQNKLEVLSNYRRDKLNKFRAVIFNSDSDIFYNVKLPDSFTCAKCVLQWRWFAASTGEEFKNCADISILSVDSISTNFQIIQNITNFSPTTLKLSRTTKLKRKSTKKHEYNSIYENSRHTNKITKFNGEFIENQNIDLKKSTSIFTAPYKNNLHKNTTTLKNFKPLYACSNHNAPIITEDNEKKKFNGFMVICFRSKNNKEVDCELCKKMCTSLNTICPEDECQCIWY